MVMVYSAIQIYYRVIVYSVNNSIVIHLLAQRHWSSIKPNIVSTAYDRFGNQYYVRGLCVYYI